MMEKHKEDSRALLIQCFFPMIIMVLLQAVILFVGVLLNVVGTGRGFGAENIEEAAKAMNIPMLVVSNLILAVFMGLWYKRLGGKAAGSGGIGFKKTACLKIVGILIGLGICIQLAVSMVLSILESIRPQWFVGYNQLLETTGMGTSILSFLAVVLLAPLAEELVFRGVTLLLAEKIMSFPWANFFQAAFFGFIHGNLIQGSYAFLLGLLLGLTVKWGKSICPGVVLHLCVNLAGCILSIFMKKWEHSILFYFEILMLSFVSGIWVLLWLRKELQGLVTKKMWKNHN